MPGRVSARTLSFPCATLVLPLRDRHDADAARFLSLHLHVASRPSDGIWKPLAPPARATLAASFHARCFYFMSLASWPSSCVRALFVKISYSSAPARNGRGSSTVGRRAELHRSPWRRALGASDVRRASRVSETAHGTRDRRRGWGFQETRDRRRAFYSHGTRGRCRVA